MLPYINIFGAALPSYGLCVVAGILLGCFFAYRSIRNDPEITKENAPPEVLLATVAVCLLFFMIGSKLLYILVTYDFEYIISSFKNRNFEFLGGSGTVFYGGLIFGIIGTSLTMCLFGLDFRIFEKHIVPYIPLGHAVGRIGCLLAGCCYGMEYSGIGAVRYPNALTGLSPDTGYFPVQPMESVLDLVIMAMLIIFAKKKRQKGDILCLYLMLYAITRIITEAFRGDVHRGVFWGISTSQWISIALILFVFTRRIYRKIAKKE